MGKNNPFISICMPTYNRGHYIASAISSVLQQTYDNFELIIGNDGSTDSTDEVIKRFKDKRIHYFKNPTNKGYIYTMNKCTSLAKGEWIMHLSDDDKLHTALLSKQVKAIRENSNKQIGFVVPQTINVNNEGEVIMSPSKQSKKNYIVFSPTEFIPNFTLYGSKIKDKYRFNTSFPSTLFNKKIFVELGMSSKKVPVAHDLLIEAKICLKYPVIVIDEPLCEYMIHENLGSSLNQNGSFLFEYVNYLSLLFDFVEKEHIGFPYDFKKYCYHSLVSYLFRINGGLVRMSARYSGGFQSRIRLILKYVQFGLKHDKSLLLSVSFYASTAIAFLPKIFILKIGKLLRQI